MIIWYRYIMFSIIIKHVVFIFLMRFSTVFLQHIKTYCYNVCQKWVFKYGFVYFINIVWQQVLKYCVAYDINSCNMFLKGVFRY